jgi:hypothetical protein
VQEEVSFDYFLTAELQGQAAEAKDLFQKLATLRSEALQEAAKGNHKVPHIRSHSLPTAFLLQAEVAQSSDEEEWERLSTSVPLVKSFSQVPKDMSIASVVRASNAPARSNGKKPDDGRNGLPERKLDPAMLPSAGRSDCQTE